MGVHALRTLAGTARPLRPSMRISPVLRLIFFRRQFFVRAVDQLRACPDEAELEGDDGAHGQSEMKFFGEEDEINECARRYRSENEADTYAFGQVGGLFRQASSLGKTITNLIFHFRTRELKGLLVLHPIPQP